MRISCSTMPPQRFKMTRRAVRRPASGVRCEKHPFCAMPVVVYEGHQMVAVPVISSRVLRGIPTFIRSEFGERALQRVNRATGLDLELIEDRNCFIPHQAVTSFADTIAREAGEPNLGLLLAPTMDVSNYGSFGSYVLGADTLGQAIHRGIEALRYHCTCDRLSVAALADEIRFSYRFALAGAAGYGVVACAAAGELLSVCRAYLPHNWRPLRIELDVEAPCRTSPFEDVFQCPVVFNAPAVAVVLERQHLAVALKRRPLRIVTIEDVARDLPDGAPRALLGVVMEQIRAQILTGHVLIDDVARSIDISVRTLQRELLHAGADFRSLTSIVRIQRATELLRQSGESITGISAELGYSSPAAFARAFRKATGTGPREFRKLGK